MHTDPVFVILHIGLGSFHRAHQAVYLHALHQLGDTRWILAAGNTRPDMPDTIAALQASGGAYTLETVTPQGESSYTRIASIKKILPYQPGLTNLIEVGADANTRIISFTVTEAGYYLNAENKLDLNFADLAADLRSAKLAQPGSTIYGVLTAILRTRMQAQAGPVTLLNCDNLRHNGKRFHSGLVEFIELAKLPDLLAWVRAHTSCPNAMVDRITPRPTPEVRARVKAATGIDDPAALMGESFTQWVIEDNFAAGRPAWENVGVQMVTSVAAYEEAKIRLLNATHSCIAWAGTLLGYEFIHQGMQNLQIRKFAYDYVSNDVIPVLTQADQPSPIDLPTYRDVVLQRFGNAAVADTNQRVAMDGFSKIPGFIAPTIHERLIRNESIDSVAILPALFLAYLQRWHSGKIHYEYQDQAMDAAAAHAMCEADDPVAIFASNTALWGVLTQDKRLLTALRKARECVAVFEKEHTHG